MLRSFSLMRTQDHKRMEKLTLEPEVFDMAVGRKVEKEVPEFMGS